MQFSRFAGVYTRTLILFAAATLVLTASAMTARAEHPATTLNTLLDRAQIEDLLVDYYAQLGSGGGKFSDYYVEDGVLDVNGIIAKGKEEIEGLYKKSGEGSALPQGAFRMLLTNIKIVVNGTSATADMIWTGVNSETVKSTPRFVEQGREHDDLVKRSGRWYFKHRVITADGGLSPMYEKTYQKR